MTAKEGGRLARAALAAGFGAVALAVLLAETGRTEAARSSSHLAAHAAGNRAEHSATGSVSNEKIIRYIRDRFGVAHTVKMSMGSMANSVIPGYYQAVLTSNDGKNPEIKNLLISRDGRYLVIGDTFPLGGDPKGEIAKTVRTTFKLPDAVQLTVGAFHRSGYPSLSETTITAEQGGRKNSQNFYVSANERTFVLGQVFDMSDNPYQRALHTLNLQNQPTVGSAEAPVTIVEFADLECPMCARYEQYIDTQLLPKYGSKVRVVFKDFPLPGHDWSTTAAVANQCAYQLKPSTYHPYRSLIFANQMSINATNVRDQLLVLGEQAGLDRLKLSACIDAKESWPRIQADLDEGQKVNVAGTPTFFVNGHMIYGVMPDQFDAVVDNALAQR